MPSPSNLDDAERDATSSAPQDHDAVEIRRTLLWESLRACLTRPAAAAVQGSGVLLLIALQHFEADPTTKALIAGANFIGLMLSPLAVRVVARSGLPVGRALGLAAWVGAAGLAIAATSETLRGFTLGIMLGIPIATSCTPLVTTLWRQAVPDAVRGRWFGRILSLAGLFTVLASLGMGRWLRADIGRYRPLVLAIALSLVLAGLAAARIPTRPIRRSPGRLYGALALLWREPRFGLINLSWFLLGFGNLATIPLRTEYLGAPGSGLGYDPEQVLLLTLVIPQSVTLVTTLVWGGLFDRLGFRGLRVTVNLCFAAGILLFFWPSWPMQVAGAAMTGLAFGGEGVLWGLWVTRYAPPERTAEYMSVHTFLTGVRGFLGPLAAYALIGALPLISVTRIGAGLVLLSALLFTWVLRPTALPSRIGRPAS